MYCLTLYTKYHVYPVSSIVNRVKSSPTYTRAHTPDTRTLAQSLTYRHTHTIRSYFQ